MTKEIIKAVSECAKLGNQRIEKVLIGMNGFY